MRGQGCGGGVGIGSDRMNVLNMVFGKGIAIISGLYFFKKK